MMIRDQKILENEMKPWTNDGAADEKALTWIWNQLMGETAKGHTLEFVIMSRGVDEDYEKLFVGVLKDAEGEF